MIRAFTKWTLLLSLLFSLGLSSVYAQEEETEETKKEKVKIKVTGVVKGEQGDGIPDIPLPAANIIVQGKAVGTTTDKDGAFTLETKAVLPVDIAISMYGFKTAVFTVNKEEFELGDVMLEEGPVLGQNEVTGPSRVAESQMQSAVPLEVLNSGNIDEAAGHNYYDAISDFSGVGSITPSLGLEIYNTRGFNNNINTRFVQLVDGVDATMPSLNYALGNLMGPSALDIERIELLPGTGSPMYGSGAFNGVLQTVTKDPFKHQGLSVMVKTGVNHINEPESENHLGFREPGATIDEVAPEPSPYFEGALRFAKTFLNDKLAIKLDGSFMQGNDWWATNFTNLNGNGNRFDDPIYNGLNVYGDEAVRPIFNQRDRITELVSRTGYDEKYLTNYDVVNYKGNASIHYNIFKDVKVGYGFNIGVGTNMHTEFNRIRFDEVNQWQHKAEVKGKHFFIRGSMTSENTNQSYDLGLTAIQINRAWKSDDLWYTDYENTFNSVFNGINRTTAHQEARRAADRGRLNPNSAEFDRELRKARTIADYDIGSRYALQSTLYNGEAMFDLSPFTGKIVDVMVGGNYKYYELDTRNNLMIDTEDNQLTNFERGGYIQLSRKFFKKENLKLSASVRYDESEQIEETRISPRASIVYTAYGENSNHNFRITYQEGFRMPSVMEQFMDVNIGSAIILGGLPGVYDRYQINDPNVYTLNSIDDFLLRYEQEVAAGKAPNLVLLDSTNTRLLQNHEFTSLKPESVTTYEGGYRGLINNRLMIDVSGYYSEFENFVGLRYVARPSIDGTVDPGGNLRNIRDRFFNVFGVYDNSSSLVTTYGGVARISYRSVKGYVIGASYAYNTIDLGDDADDLVAPFNTPEHRASMSFGQRELTNNKNLGFNITWNWQDAFEWESVYSQGTVKAFNTFDVQVSYKIEPLKSVVQLGGSNILNTRFENYFGGPTVGALYYLSVTMNLSM